MAITAGMTVDQLSKVDLCYARLKSCKGRDSSACGWWMEAWRCGHSTRSMD